LSLSPLVDGLLFRARLNDGNDLRALREVVEVRIALDLSVAEQLVGHYRGTTNPELTGLVDEMRRLAPQGEAFANADTAFHETLLAPLPNGLLRQLAQAFWEIHTVAVPLLGIAPAERIIDTINAHQAMLNALEAGDAEAYRQAVLDHYRPLEGVLDAAGAARLDGAAGAGPAAVGVEAVVGRAARGLPRPARARGGPVAALDRAGASRGRRAAGPRGEGSPRVRRGPGRGEVRRRRLRPPAAAARAARG